MTEEQFNKDYLFYKIQIKEAEKMYESVKDHPLMSISGKSLIEKWENKLNDLLLAKKIYDEKNPKLF